MTALSERLERYYEAFGDPGSRLGRMAHDYHERHCTESACILTVYDDEKAVHTADKGDWIIRGIKGEFYPCKPDIFAATYEPVAPTDGGGAQ